MNRDESLSVRLMDIMDRAIADGDYNKCDILFSGIDPAKYSKFVCCSMLIITINIKNKLKERDKFLDKLKLVHPLRAEFLENRYRGGF